MHPEGARTGERRSRPRESPGTAARQRPWRATPPRTSPPALSRARGAPRGSEATARRRRGAGGEDVFPRLRIALGAAHPRGCSPRAAGHGSRPLGTSTPPVQRRLPSPGIRAAGTTPAVTGTAQPAEPRPGVPARAGVRRARGAHTSEAVCQAEIRRRKSEESRGNFPRPALRQLLRRGATTPSGPAGDFHLLQGAPGPAPGKRPRTRAVDFSPHSLGRGKRRSASPHPSSTPIGPTQRPRSPSHTRGRGRAGRHSNQRAGGRALLLRGPRRELRAAQKLLLRPPASSLLPFFLPG